MPAMCMYIGLLKGISMSADMMNEIDNEEMVTRKSAWSASCCDCEGDGCRACVVEAVRIKEAPRLIWQNHAIRRFIVGV